MEPDRVGIPDEIEPVDSHPLAEMRRVEQTLDQPFISVRIVIRDERTRFPGAGRQARQIEAQTADESAPVRLADRAEPLLFQSRVDDMVDSRGSLWRLDALQRDVGQCGSYSAPCSIQRLSSAF